MHVDISYFEKLNLLLKTSFHKSSLRFSLIEDNNSFLLVKSTELNHFRIRFVRHQIQWMLFTVFWLTNFS